MDVVSDFLETLAGGVIFFSAIALVVLMTGSVILRQDYISDYTTQTSAISTSYNWEHSEHIISYEELCSRIMQGIPCDVLIDGTLVEYQWFQWESFDYQMIRPEKDYLVSYSYNEDGSYRLITYQSI